MLTELPRYECCQRTGDSDAVGWRLSLPPDYRGKRVSLWLLVLGQPGFPPLAYVIPSTYPEWPHCDQSGKLCLWRDGHHPVWDSPKNQLSKFQQKLTNVINLSLKVADKALREDDFRDEWLAYWPSRCASHLKQAAYLTSVPEQSGSVGFAGWLPRAKGLCGPEMPPLVVGDRKETVARWKISQTFPAAFLFLDIPPISPTLGCVRDIRDLIDRHCREDFDLINFLQKDSQRPHVLIFVHFTQNGYAAAGLILEPVKSQLRRGGYRSKHWKDKYNKNATSSHWEVSAVDVERADIDWVHGRGHDAAATALRDCHIALVGCGALGGLVADALVRAGLRKLTLIDPDCLSPANLGRHILGAPYLGVNKARALADRLSCDLPYLQVTAKSKPVEQLLDEFDSGSFDLVASTAADGSAERTCWALVQSGVARNFAMAWVEPLAYAGHSVVSKNTTVDIEALFDLDGKPVFRATSSPDTTVSRIPGCAAEHIPGSYVRIGQVAGMIAEHIIDNLVSSPSSSYRLWLGNYEGLIASGGRWLEQSMHNGERRSVVLNLRCPIA